VLLEPIADRKWDEVSPVERAILMIGAWELVHNPGIPYRVTINEAVELGKRFGGTDGHKYVNGVLDKLATAVRPEEVARPPRERGAASNTRRKKNG
ncbi:MAG: transcription antitermination protein NusB, partial [Usitatibacter sp.]